MANDVPDPDDIPDSNTSDQDYSTGKPEPASKPTAPKKSIEEQTTCNMTPYVTRSGRSVIKPDKFDL
ncbi:hypothetical protein DPMN_112336 [Dreissena polymorpha]|uniref:Uncharacterized protein n=1 Tax=Dreissena polymorpha TaxID=45954 RepID=A0A9D4QPT8_DREPO|nr:hypothetical protein DPMN_112336 [Dreissena polymorpha]